MQEGYSIYVVFGNLPDCTADQILALTPAVQHERPELMTVDQVRGTSTGTTEATSPMGAAKGRTGSGVDDEAFRTAMALSLAERRKEGALQAEATGE